MNIVPKRALHDPAALNVIPSEKGMFVMECEVIDPPSLTSRAVYLFLNDEEVTALLLELRSSAREARR